MEGLLIYGVGILTLGGIYAALALILNLEAGWAGLWDLGIAGLVGAGAYFFVIVTLSPAENPEMPVALGWPIWAGVIGSAAFTALVALVIGLPSLRLRGEYFLITTFAFAEVIRQIFINESTLTRGVVGFNQLDRPFGSAVHPADYRYLLLVIVAVAVFALWLFVRRVGRSPFGRLLRALRDNEPVAMSLGKNITRHRVQTFVLAGALTGAVAPLYVWYMRRVVPDLFAADLTFVVWTALVIGGIGSFSGPVVGAIALIALIEGLQLLQVSAEHAVLLSASRPFILGLALILVLRYLPGGIVPERRAFRRASSAVEPRAGRFPPWARGRRATFGRTHEEPQP